MKTTQSNLSLSTLSTQLQKNVLTTEDAINTKGGATIGVKSRYKPRQTSSIISSNGTVGGIRVNANGYAVEGLL